MRAFISAILWLTCISSGSAAGTLIQGENPRYFAKPNGTPVYLAGAHDGWEWQDFAWGDTARESPFAWDAFLNMLSDRGHNVIRFWSVEHTKITDDDKDLTDPMPWLRVPGQGKAHDGGDKFDLDQFNPAFFERLKIRVSQAGNRGIYVIVMLFEGWSIDSKGGKVNPWPYHPFHHDNNINKVDGDVDGDGQGSDVHTWLGADHPVTLRQRAFVRKVVDTVKDFDNVLFEIANESHTASLDWQNRMVDFVRECERDHAKQHPIGITVPFGGAKRAGLNEALFKSRADWISPNREGGRGFDFRTNPPMADGRKVVLLDTDHIQGNKLQDATWIWKAFCRGYNVLFMDRWTEEPDDPKRQEVRIAVGATVSLARRLDLRRTLPSTTVSSTGYCLTTPGRQYIVFQPESQAFTVDLKGAKGELKTEWIDAKTGKHIQGKAVKGGTIATLHAPFEGPAVVVISTK